MWLTYIHIKCGLIATFNVAVGKPHYCGWQSHTNVNEHFSHSLCGLGGHTVVRGVDEEAPSLGHTINWSNTKIQTMLDPALAGNQVTINGHSVEVVESFGSCGRL